MNLTRRTLLAASLGTLAGGRALAQDFPSRNIRFVVPFGAGGSADIVARVLQPQLQSLLGRTVIVDNRPGAAGNIGMGEVARAEPDGHTIALAPTNTLATNQFLFRNMAFDPATAFAPVTLLCVLHNMLVIGSEVPATSPQAFFDWARGAGRRINYGSAGVGSQAHLAGELIRRIGGFEATHIAYRNSTEALTDMVRGEITYMIAQEVAARPFLTGGRIKALGTAALQRTQSSPELATLHEQGLTGFEARSWFALVAPAGTPAPVIARLNGATRTALEAPEVRTVLAQQGVEAAGGTAEELGVLIRAEIGKWGRVIREANIRME